MSIWNVSYDSRIGRFRYAISDAAGGSLPIPLVSSVFELLRVSASLYDGKHWWALHSAPNLGNFETTHGVDMHRWRYNDRSFRQVFSRGRTLRGQHAGLIDLFVPVVIKSSVVAILVTGPFAQERATLADVLARWRSLTGRQAHLGDPDFASYLQATVSMLVLAPAKADAFQELLECLAKLLARQGHADELVNRADALRLALESVRFVDRVWETVQMMTSERSARATYSPAIAYELKKHGLSRVPDQVLVALARSAKPSDPVDELLRRDALQRSAAELAREMGDTIAGKVGEYGVVFLMAMKGSASSKRRQLLALSERVRSLARRRFGLELFFGASQGARVLPSRAYQVALAAAEAALTQGHAIQILDSAASVPRNSLRRLSDALATAIQDQPSSLPAKFERFLEVLTLSPSYRPEAARAELEICFQRIADSLLRTGLLDPKSFDDMCDRVDRTARETGALRDLIAVYRAVVFDMARGVLRPVEARQERGVRRALDFIHAHYSEPLRLKQVAMVAGFAPKYFATLFKRREKSTFEGYVFRMRLERAKQLLRGTDLTATRVAELSGLRSVQYLSRSFRRVLNVTPLQFREGKGPHAKNVRSAHL